MKQISGIHLKIWITVCMFVLPISLSHAQRPSASLRGNEAEGAMKLYWETYEWPKDLHGFNIKKKTSEDTLWKKMNTEVIYPQMDERDWKNLGFNEAQAEQMQKTYQSYIASGEIRAMSSKVLIEKFQQAGGPQSGDRIRMKNNFNLALIFGFGYIDNSYSKTGTTTYGLFYVDGNGIEAQAPAVVFTPGKKVVVDPEVQFEVNRKKILLNWTVSEKTYRLSGLYGFRIYRTTGKSKQRTALVGEPLGYQEKKEGNMEWVYTDIEGDLKLDHTYTLVPVTIFQTELPVVSAKYKAADHQPVTVPVLDSIALANEVHMKLYWTGDQLRKEKKRIKELYVERRKADTLAYIKVIREVSVNSHSVVDTTGKKYGERYYYRLVAVDLKGKQWYGESFDVLYTGVKLPKTPDSLRAEFKRIMDRPYVVLSWTAPKDASASAYLLQTDESEPGKFRENNSIPWIRDTHFLYEIRGDGGRKIQFKIVPLSEAGVRGEPALASCVVPLLRLPPFDGFSATLGKNQQVELSWEYPDDIPLKGFNIWSGGEIIATTKDISSGERKYTVQLFLPEQYGRVNEFAVEAVGEAAHKKSTVRPVYLPATGMKAPGKVVAEIKKEKSNRYVLLAWEAVKQADMAGYILYADLDTEGVFDRVNKKNILKTTTYNYQVTDYDRKKFTFRVAAVTGSGIAGPAAEVIVHMKDLKK